MSIPSFPFTPEAIRERMQACRDELESLKRLLRAAEAMQRADEARQRRGTPLAQVGGIHGR
jgi:hypothetical protein